MPIMLNYRHVVSEAFGYIDSTPSKPVKVELIKTLKGKLFFEMEYHHPLQMFVREKCMWRLKTLVCI